MVTHVDVLSLMDAESKRASEPRKSSTPTFLRLNDRQKARIRPLFNLSQVLALSMHSKFNTASPKDSVNAVCASEVGGDCLYCAAAKDDRKLSAGVSFFLPVYLSTLEEKGDDGKWSIVTFKKDDGTEQAVSGLRILELKAFGTINTVFQAIRSLYAEDDQHDIRLYGLVVERVGAGQKTEYTILPKGPSQMPDAAKALIPTADTVRSMILSACPPAGTAASTPPSTATNTTGNDNGGKNGQKDDFDF